jgi:radical SAM protein with 4Fe4S-binding SPASM domain
MQQHLEFTLAALCPINCGFCPQTKLKGAYHGPEKFMALPDFIAILEKVPAEVEIHFSGFTEPFLNPNAGTFIYLSKMFKKHRVAVYSTLIGMKEQASKLVSLAKPDLIRIHVPDTKHMVYDPIKWIAQHKLFLAVNLSATYMTMGELELAVADHLKGISVETPEMISRGGNLWAVFERTGHIRCAADRWHCNVVMPNGDVYGDCMDYGLTVKLGNLLNQSYQEIFDMAEVWKATFKDEHSICAQCEWSLGV